MITDNPLEVVLQFCGGAELLVGKKKAHNVSLPNDRSWTLKDLIMWVSKNLLTTDRPELFMEKDTVRPGILVLVNDVDWELLGTMACSGEVRKMAGEFVGFLNKAVTPFHAVHECKKLLISAGFTELKESDPWSALKPKEKYFLTRNSSSIIAFAVGGKYKPGNGFSMIVGHTDSPCLRVKPVSKLCSADTLQVGVSTYGGGLWHTWFDRDLSVAGRVIVKMRDGSLSQRLVHLEKPLLFIPNLAIHLTTDRDKFVVNKEDHLRPILATKATDELNNTCTEAGNHLLSEKKVPEAEKGGTAGVCADHHATFLRMLAANADCDPADLIDLDLCLFDSQKAAVTGVHDEFICGARLDNLVSCYAATVALIESLKSDQSLTDDPNIRILACYDNEEVGSESAQGAGTSLTEWILRRLAQGSDGQQNTFEQAIAKSMLISADQAHAVHPNYKSKHEENHQISLHGGVTIKINVNQRYATTAITHAIMKVVADNCGVPLQKFVIRNDSPCGSTVGPILSAKLGLRTVDLGTPQYAMHSIREMMGTCSIQHATKLFKALNREAIKCPNSLGFLRVFSWRTGKLIAQRPVMDFSRPRIHNIGWNRKGFIY